MGILKREKIFASPDSLSLTDTVILSNKSPLLYLTLSKERAVAVRYTGIELVNLPRLLGAKVLPLGTLLNDDEKLDPIGVFILVLDLEVAASLTLGITLSQSVDESVANKRQSSAATCGSISCKQTHY